MDTTGTIDVDETQRFARRGMTSWLIGCCHHDDVLCSECPDETSTVRRGMFRYDIGLLNDDVRGQYVDSLDGSSGCGS